ALAPVWLVLELVLHFKHDTPLGKGMAKFEDPFKWLIMIACIASVAWSFSTGRLVDEPWVGYKILLFALIMFFSLMINKTIGPYITGIQRIAEGEIDEAENTAMAASLRQVKWAVIGIWIALVAEVVIGVAKPGG
ncbi:MAG: hypothetical protein QGF91_05275, partial [Gammaproteobacteria bacterium]|nr:hypothetical protein [Gammaproteobacteria bacterium]